MLATLRIKNLALVQELALDWAEGYNAITGETGAGKSVIIGALNLVLGERADRTVIRAGAESCSVEAVFEARGLAPGFHDLLEEKGLEPCEENQLVLKRIFTNSGTNKQFINGSATTLSVLAQVGNWLLDMHGPHEHQSLLHAPEQLRILDAYAGVGDLLRNFAKLRQELIGLLENKAELIIDEKTYAQQLDLLRFQVTEIENAKLRPEEEQELENEHSRASNAARLLELSQHALAALSEDENALLSQAGGIGRSLHELQRLDARAGDLVDIHEQAVALFTQLQRELGQYADSIEVDPGRLQELEERVNAVQALKRKYGSTIAEVIEFGANAREKLEALESRDEEIARLNEAIKKIESELWKVGKELSSERRKIVSKLSKAVVKELRDLGFQQSFFDVSITTWTREEAFARAVPVNGFDAIEFQFGPNPGEPARPLRAIASSGELARVMLALKTVLAAEDQVPVLVFDEVDANIGGETAVAVGEKMRQIGKKRQVLCITHLAPVAAAAGSHYLVSKEIKEGRTFSNIAPLQGKERVAEIARMLGGQGEAARKHAESLLKSGPQK